MAEHKSVFPIGDIFFQENNYRLLRTYTYICFKTNYDFSFWQFCYKL